MYEAEVNGLVEPLHALPPEIQKRFLESRDEISARTILPWGEHCTECNWPTCYSTCELYSPRTDGGCRLFITGMVRVDHPGTASGYVLKIEFKRWGKLWTVGNLDLLSVSSAAQREKSNMFTGAVARSLPLPPTLKRKVLGKVSYMRRRSTEDAPPSAEPPDCFLFECYNPNSGAINLTFTVRTRGSEAGQSFQQMISVPPGFTRERILFPAIAAQIDTRRPFDVEIVPNECENTVLYFGLMDFVKEQPRAQAKPTDKGGKKWKCIVWDLDNTLWDGILVEDGPEKIQIRQKVIDVIKETDRRGILHSVASKNNSDAVLKLLKQFGIDDYFLYPQISWEPKSQSVARIAKLLNIGLDTVAFVDDQPFERAEVKTALPEIFAIDTAEFECIPGRSECLVPITEESTKRRMMYRQQEQRNIAQETHGGNYTEFLRNCNIRLTIGPLTEDNLDRVYELAQRTNQMNFSGSRYPRPQLKELIQSKSRHSFVIKCNDRFGSYGIVGFAVVDADELRLLDLMFSCRVQSKRVEHAVLTYLLKHFVVTRARDFFANYRPTPKNMASGKVFEEIGFQREKEDDGMLSLIFPKHMAIPDEGIISTAYEDPHET